MEHHPEIHKITLKTSQATRSMFVLIIEAIQVGKSGQCCASLVSHG